MHGGGPPSLVICDDQGTKVDAHFAGSGSDIAWEGSFTSLGPLNRETAFLEIDGVRLDLGEEAPEREVRIEALPDADPARAHLWWCVSASEAMHTEANIEPTIDALVVAGALAADDPEIDQVRAVMAAHQGGTQRKLPEPWRSLRSWGARRGPEGTIVVGATPPVFDGYALAVNSLHSSEHGWSLDVEVKPDPGMYWHPFGASEVRPRWLTWWAKDDRGNHFLGEINDWGGRGSEGGRGTIGFHAALDPKAKHLDLMPTGLTHRVVIRVPLKW
jgi:hypothetical protein